MHRQHLTGGWPLKHSISRFDDHGLIWRRAGILAVSRVDCSSSSVWWKRNKIVVGHIYIHLRGTLAATRQSNGYRSAHLLLQEQVRESTSTFLQHERVLDQRESVLVEAFPLETFKVGLVHCWTAWLLSTPP
eukprot:COSAG02_NODE_18535_length_933_cov_6.841085_2_plen_132_part_00